MEKTLNTKRHKELVSFLIKKRMAFGLTQTELAERLDEYQSWVARLESGQRRVDVVEFERLAEVLNFEVSEFYT